MLGHVSHRSLPELSVPASKISRFKDAELVKREAIRLT